MKDKLGLLYWIATGLFSVMMLASAGILIFRTEMRTEEFGVLGFPPFLVYFLAVAKPLGVVAILTNLSLTLKEWAYAGFFFNFLLAFIAHLIAGDGDFIAPIVATMLLFASYFSYRRSPSLRPDPENA